jgi:hypothetical protein
MHKYYITNKEEFVGEEGHEILLKKLIPKMSIFQLKALAIDVGANKGNEWPNLEKILKNDLAGSKILAFEPNPVNHPILESKKTDFVDFFPFAISNKESQAPLYCWRDASDNKPGYSLAGLRAGGSKICDVEIRTLDGVLKEYPDDEYVIKYLKIDTEGNDTLVLEGCRKNLHRVHYIIFEASDCLDDFRGPAHNEPLKTCVDMLDAEGFNVYRIGTKRLLKLNGDAWNSVYETRKFWSNCFAIKKTDPVIHELINDEGFFI